MSRRARRHITRTISAPTTAALIRHPNGSMPKAFSPSAISHLPTSGCTTIDGSLSQMPVVWPWMMSALMSVLGLPSASFRYSLT